MIVPAQSQNLQVKPRWVAPVGVMESVVAYNCRKYGMPRPVLAMPIWEGAGNRAIDLSGHGNHGDLIGDPSWCAGGLDFDGVGDYVTTKVLEPDAFTVVICAKLDTKSADRRLVGTSSTNMSYLIWYDVNNDCWAIRVKTISDQWTSDNNPSTPSVGKWYQLILSFSTPNGAFYIDGKLEVSTSSISGTSFQSGQPFRFGGGLGYSPDTDGKVAYTMFYDCGFSATQIKFLSDNPYFMYRLPEELYGYAAAAAGVSIPVFMHHYNQLRGA